MKPIAASFIYLVALVSIGCAPSEPRPADHPAEFIKPTIAVMKFENRAPFPLNWDLGTGLQDVLVHRLVSTGRYHVIERPEIESVLKELRFEQSGMTRDEEKAAMGKLKNVQYLVKGTITDFTHVAGEHGFVGLGSFGAGGGDNQAVMAMTMYVVDVQSGEIICSEAIQQTVHAADLNLNGTYKNVAFGGSIFYRTPLGEATSSVIEKAVNRITQVIGQHRWEPRIARVGDDGRVILNGGHDRELVPGVEFDVLAPGVPILDPDTGDLIGHEHASAIGRLRVAEVQDRYSVATILSGQPATMKVGQPCRRVSAGVARIEEK